MSGHPNITPLLALSKAPAALVMEFFAHGDLTSFIVQGHAASWRAKLRIAFGMYALIFLVVSNVLL